MIVCHLNGLHHVNDHDRITICLPCHNLYQKVLIEYLILYFLILFIFIFNNNGGSNNNANNNGLPIYDINEMRITVYLY